jgi:ferritin-like metal-binding protein YciE
MPAKQKELNDLFLDMLKDVFHAEKQLLRALPKMARAAKNEELRNAMNTHREETQGQVERLEQMFEMIGKRAQGKPCEAMMGLVAEGQEIMEEYKDSPALEAGMIAAQQAIEHYEIARYGTMRTWAQQLGMNDAIPLIEQTLEEEKKTDQLLTQLAERSANQEAEQQAAE